MIAVTQACLNPDFKPLGLVVCEHTNVERTPSALIKETLAALKHAAPSGTTHLFNCKFVPLENGRSGFLAMADAYADSKPAFVPRGEIPDPKPQDGVSDVDAPIQGSPHYYG